ALDALDHRIGDLVVGDVAPPREDVGLRERRLAESVLRLVKRRGSRPQGRVLAQRGGDALVHRLGVGRADARLFPIVDILAPDGHADHWRPLPKRRGRNRIDTIVRPLFASSSTTGSLPPTYRSRPTGRKSQLRLLRSRGYEAMVRETV